MDVSNPITAIIPSLEGQVLSVLARTTAQLSGNRIAKLSASGGQQGISKALHRLVSSGIVRAEVAGPSILYSANRKHVLWAATEALMHAADHAPLAIREEMAAVVTRILSTAEAKRTSLSLFGSTARGDSTADSDIDLLALFPETVEAHVREAIVDELTERVPLWTGNECNVYSVTEKQLEHLVATGDPLIEVWQREGSTFHGTDIRAHIARVQRSA